MSSNKHKKKSSSHKDKHNNNDDNIDTDDDNQNNNQNDIGYYKLIKSDINLNLKNFVGFDDSDYQMITNLNNSDVSFAVKNNVCVGNSLIVGYDSNEITNKINKDNKQNYPLDVKGDSVLDGNLIVKEKLFVENSVFFNKDMFLPNPFVLEDENISNISELTICSDSLSYSTYKFLLKNILDKTKSSSKKQISSIKFFNDSTNFTQTIIPINKKFIFEDIQIHSFLLSYCIYFKNKIIEVKPIMDTFILINNHNNTFKLVLDTNYNQNDNNDKNNNENNTNTNTNTNI